jgi:hypothetical protein
MLWLFGSLGIAVVIVGLALAELLNRANVSFTDAKRMLASVLLPATYLFFGLIAMFGQ